MRHCIITLVVLAVFCKAVFSRILAKVEGCPNTDGIFGICVFDPMKNCVRQDQCPEGYKCCPYGCGSQCLAVSLHLNHPGSCPTTTASTTGTACHQDMECNANEKCCHGHCTAVRKFSVPVTNVLV